MTVSAMLRHPSALLPLVMSVGALAMVVWFVAAHGIARQPDESAQARAWQILMAVQVPVIAYFALQLAPARASSGADRADASGSCRRPCRGACPAARLLTAPIAGRARAFVGQLRRCSKTRQATNAAISAVTAMITSHHRSWPRLTGAPRVMTEDYAARAPPEFTTALELACPSPIARS